MKKKIEKITFDLNKIYEGLVVNAPPVPDWFEPIMPDAPKKVIFDSQNYSYERYNSTVRPVANNNYVLTEKERSYFTWYTDALKDSSERMENYAIAKKFQSAAQWPWYYANLVVSGKDKILK